MKKVIYFLFFICTVYFSFAQNKNEIVIKNINLIAMTGDKVENNKSILIKNNKIAQIDDFSKLKFSKKAIVIDGTNKFVMPALADMHIHLPAENKIEEILALNIAAGVARVRVMNSEISQLSVRDALQKKTEIISPKLYCSHIIRKQDKFSVEELEKLMLQIKKDKLSFIKLFSVADETTFDNLMQAANKHKITVCGHYPGKISVEKVLNSGFKSIEHVGGLDNIADEAKLNDAINLSKKNNTYHCPTLDYFLMAADLQFPDDYKKRLVFNVANKKTLDNWETEYQQAVVESKGAENVIKNKNNYMPRFKKQQKIVKMLNDSNGNLLLGSDPGSYFQMAGFNLHQEMLDWSDAGIDNFSILKAATVNAASFFNESKIWGTIAKGFDADLIILDKNPLENITNITSVETTITNGKIYNKSNILGKL